MLKDHIDDLDFKIKTAFETEQKLFLLKEKGETLRKLADLID